MNLSKWDARIRRAEELISSYPFASEGLSFYIRLAAVQKSLYEKIASASGSKLVARAPGALRQEFDPFLLLPLFPAFLSQIGDFSPAPVSQAACSLRSKDAAHWRQFLESFWQAGPDLLLGGEGPAQNLLAWMFLQPYAEYLADRTEREPIHATPSRCPLCSAKPLAGILRPEGDGAKRSLLCALCSTEWAFRRIVCPACGEEDVRKLAIYTAEEFPHVRVEACDTCRTYIKTVDLTKNGRAVPIVDELATIPLNLWATEHSYTKLQVNLLGV